MLGSIVRKVQTESKIKTLTKKKKKGEYWEILSSSLKMSLCLTESVSIRHFWVTLLESQEVVLPFAI